VANTTITPGSGTARFTTNIVVGVTVASLLANGIAGLLGLGIAPGTNNVSSGLLIAGGLPAINFGITPPVVACVATGTTAVLAYGSAPSIPAGNLIAQGTLPRLALGAVTPSSGSGVLSGSAPTVTIPNSTITPDNTNPVFQGYAPLISNQHGGTTGSLILAGVAPQLGLSINLTSAGTYPLRMSGQSSLLNLIIVVPGGNLGMTTAGQSPSLTPNTAIALFQGNSVIFSGPVVVNPGSGSLTALGYVSSEQLTVPAPPCAALVLGGLIPSVGQSYSVKPASGSLIFTGNAPVQPVQSTVITPPTVSVLVGQAPSALAFNLQTFSASVSFSGTLSIVSTGYVLTTQPGSGSYTGAASSLTPGSSSTSNSATMILSGIGPGVVIANVVSAGQMSLTGAAPLLGLNIAPNVNPLILLGSAPTVNGKTIETIPTGTVLMSGSSSTMDSGISPASGAISSGSNSGTTNLNVVSSSGSSSFLSDPSSVQLSGLPLTQTGSMVLTGNAPSVSNATIVPTATLTLNSGIPIVNSLTGINTQTGNITTSGYSPSINQTGVIVPLENDLLISGSVPLLARTGFAAPPVASMLMTGQSPLVQSTTAGQIQPGTVDMVFSGQPSYILYYEPDLYYIVHARGPSEFRVKALG
jgi:hypothetical protein